MTKQPELFDKMTFDQQLHVAGDNVRSRDIRPNRKIAGETIFEPVSNGIRVTARDEQHRVLWGFIGSKEMVSDLHCPVAMYGTLQDLLNEELKKQALPEVETADPILAAERAVEALQATVDRLRASIKVKKVSDATRDRAKAIARIVSDADQTIWLEASSLKGIKGKGTKEN